MGSFLDNACPSGQPLETMRESLVLAGHHCRTCSSMDSGTVATAAPKPFSGLSNALRTHTATNLTLSC
eukprot:6133052-Amphidinium_carterae.2